MKRIATTMLTLLLLAPMVQAQQEVTIREINAIPRANLEQLDARGAALTTQEVSDLFRSPLNGEEVKFTAIVLSDPLNSGNASPNATTGLPGRVHVFVRDTSAVSQGKLGMDMQLVDAAWQTNGLDGLVVGDVITVIGDVTYFNNTIQLAPTSVTLEGSIADFGWDESILDPIEVTTSDLNKSVGDGMVQMNWLRADELNNAFVRIENAIVVRSTVGARPDWDFTSDGGTTFVNAYDVSLRFRNDRAGYADTFNKRTTDFVPPPPGAGINVQGFNTIQGDNPFNTSLPGGINASLVPWEDSDLEITQSPPQITAITRDQSVPGTSPVTISAKVKADPSRTVASVVLNYTTSGGGSGDVAMTAGDVDDEDFITYTGVIPAAGDEEFVSFNIVATDNQSSANTSPAQIYRVLADGINEIADIQMTASGGPGDSPFRNVTIASADERMDITAVVMSDPTQSSFLVLQDDPDLGPWSGIYLASSPVALEKGDVVRITGGTVIENFSETRLTNVTLEKTGTTTPYDYKVVTTAQMTVPEVAEAHEGMMVRFENVQITETNPDGPTSNFGEWRFADQPNTTGGVRGDDASGGFPTTFQDGLTAGQKFDFMQGLWTYTFNNYKLLPETMADVQAANTPIEDEFVPGTFALAQNFPNPFSGTTTIAFQVQQAGHVSLEVFDVMGRKVATVVNETVAAGAHRATFEARDLASGLYFVRLTAEGQVLQQKMTVVK